MKIAALISTLLLLSILFIIVKIHPQGKHKSISQHASLQSWTYWIFGVSMSFFGGVILFYLQQTLTIIIGTSLLLTGVFLATWVFLFITAWIPDKGNEEMVSKIHTISGFGIAWSMTILMCFLVFTNHLPIYFRLLATITSLWYFYTWYLYYFVKNSRRNFLVYQTINIVSFFAVTLIVSVFSSV
jgi:hypothetical protein